MGISFSNFSNGQKIGFAILIIFIIFTIVAIIIGILKGTGYLDTQISEPSQTSIPVGGLALFSPSNNGKIWTKVYDSMKTSGNCFIGLNQLDYTMSCINLRKIQKYMINNNLLPIDNPFKNIVETPVLSCSPIGSRMVLTLDLTKYNGINPFKQGDSVYIFGLGNTGANNVIDPVTDQMTGTRYIYETSNENSKLVLSNQIMISEQNPCNYSSCSIDNASPLFVDDIYSGGGTVRLTGDLLNSTLHKPELMFYIYMAYKGYQFDWPFNSKTPQQMQTIYSQNYNNYLQWLANLPEICTQAAYLDNTKVGFVSGPVTVTGGSGSGLQMYIIVVNILGQNTVYPIITSDGTGYNDGDTITITQGSISKDTKIMTTLNCDNHQDIFYISPVIHLSYTTTQSQLKNIIDYAISLDNNINTIAVYSNSATTVPDNYNDPNIALYFAKTTPDTINFNVSDHNYYNIFNNNNICKCNGMRDEYNLSNFFPSKISQCANQIIYTSNTINDPYDFINNSSILTNSCKVSLCTVSSK